MVDGYFLYIGPVGQKRVPVNFAPEPSSNFFPV